MKKKDEKAHNPGLREMPDSRISGLRSLADGRPACPDPGTRHWCIYQL